MFGVLASGRLVSLAESVCILAREFILQLVCLSMQVNTNVQQAGDNTFLLAIDGAESINHVVVFLTGQVPFSQGFGGSIYFGWPSASAGAGLEGVSWQYLGYITNEKPSAIFKISSVKPKDLSANPFGQDFSMDTMMGGGGGGLAAATPHQSALIGISVEPLSEIAQKTPTTDTQASTVDSFTEFSQKMLENFFNYASSFSVDYSQLKPSETYVPFSVLQQWYTNFQRRLQANPNFWKS